MKNLIFSLTLLLALDTTGFTCTCVPSKSATTELEQSSAVFSGKVLDVKRNEQDVYASVEVVFEVERSWKGINQTTLSVFTNPHSSACGYPFKRGEAYLVYATGNTDVRLGTGLCSRTRTIKEADSDLKELGDGKEVSGKRQT